jgi:signal transduction histidine kinase
VEHTAATPTRHARTPRAARALRKARLLGLAVAGPALLVLAGWIAHAPALTQLMPWLPPVRTNVALALAAAGVGIWRSSGRGVAPGFALVPLAVGVLALVETALGVTFPPFDTLLVPRAFVAEAPVGPPPANTAGGLALLGMALLLLPRAPRAAQAVASGTVWLALGALAGHAYGIDAPDATASLRAMPVHVAVSLMVAAGAAILLRPDRGLGEALTADDTAGVAARRLLPPALLLPILLGGLVLAGERAGLYDLGSAVAVVVLTLSGLLGTGIVLALRAIRGAEQRRHSAEAARHALALREREARALVQAKEEGVQARDEFLSIASHELRTPLAALRMQVQMAQRRLADGSGGVGPRLAAADRVIGRMSRLVYDLLEVSRINSGRLPLELQLEDVDLAALVGDVVADHADAAAHAGCPLDLRADGPCVGRWDRLRIEQVVAQLLANALKYGAGKPIEVSVRGEGAWAVLSVRDHGHGVRPEERDRIFQRFERAVSIRNYGGFGLGLWIAREVIEALGGEIAVDSVPGDGATFRAALPRSPVREAEDSAAVAPPHGAVH